MSLIAGFESSEISKLVVFCWPFHRFYCKGMHFLISQILQGDRAARGFIPSVLIRAQLRFTESGVSLRVVMVIINRMVTYNFRCGQNQVSLLVWNTCSYLSSFI